MEINHVGFDVITEIRKRSREEWVQLLRERWIDTRILIQENGELSFVAAFILGVLFVLAFRLFVGAFVIGVLLVFFVINIAESKADSKKGDGGDLRDKSPDPKHHVERAIVKDFASKDVAGNVSALDDSKNSERDVQGVVPSNSEPGSSIPDAGQKQPKQPEDEQSTKSKAGEKKKGKVSSVSTNGSANQPQNT